MMGGYIILIALNAKVSYGLGTWSRHTKSGPQVLTTIDGN